MWHSLVEKITRPRSSSEHPPTASSQQQQQQQQHLPGTTTSPPSSSHAPADTTVAGLPSFAMKRLLREFREMTATPDSTTSLSTTDALTGVSDNNGRRSGYQWEWIVKVRGAEETVYAGEEFDLRFRFNDKYPLDSPEVLFLGKSPEHKHIYSNGHICLSILYDGWSPALGVRAVCLSVISMLSSSRTKERPPDDKEYSFLCRDNVSPKNMRWVFHDDTV